jgi:hypothetical protein
MRGEHRVYLQSNPPSFVVQQLNQLCPEFVVVYLQVFQMAKNLHHSLRVVILVVERHKLFEVGKEVSHPKLPFLLQ